MPDASTQKSTQRIPSSRSETGGSTKFVESTVSPNLAKNITFTADEFNDTETATTTIPYTSNPTEQFIHSIMTEPAIAATTVVTDYYLTTDVTMPSVDLENKTLEQSHLDHTTTSLSHFCTHNVNCSDSEICVNFNCVNPCIQYNPCNESIPCQAENHKIRCQCEEFAMNSTSNIRCEPHPGKSSE